MSYIFEALLNIKIFIMNKKLFVIGLIMSMMCIFLVSCDILYPPSHGPRPTPPSPGPRPTPTPTKSIDPCSKVMETTSLSDPYIPNIDANLRRQQTRTAKFTKCADTPNHAPDLMVEVKQNGRLVGTFYTSKGRHYDISLDCDSDVQLRVISTGDDICGFTITSMSAQLAGGKKDGNSTFINRQETMQERICKVELRETLYTPLRVFNNGVNNGFMVKTCGGYHTMYFKIKYRL